jgi:hypothetical protein
MQCSGRIQVLVVSSAAGRASLATLGGSGAELGAVAVAGSLSDTEPTFDQER